jgi:hypothetical protein
MRTPRGARCVRSCLVIPVDVEVDGGSPAYPVPPLVGERGSFSKVLSEDDDSDRGRRTLTTREVSGHTRVGACSGARTYSHLQM